MSASRTESNTDQRSAIRTFLIADVRGYTPFTKEHGDEAGARLAVKFEQVAREGLAALGGEVLGTRGDEVLAAFSSARRALRATVELQDAFAHETALEPSLPLRVGIGLAAGEAVRVADGFRGGAINLAARLCSQAQAGEVLASDELIALAGILDGITFERLGSFQLKGLEAPVHVTKITPAKAESAPALSAEISGPRSEFPSELDPATPLVGRERELRSLRWFWRRARHGHSRSVFLSGPSGIGKTRLASELAREAYAQHADVVYAACAGPARQAIAKLREADGAERPLLLVADDLDVAGGTVLDMVGALVSSSERPLLLIGTCQDQDSPFLSSLLGRTDPGPKRIELKPLDSNNVREIAALYAGPALAGLPVAELMEQTGGMPALVHRAAGEWARERASERLSASASRTAADRKGLRSAEAELTANVIDFQRARDGKRMYAEEPVDAVVCPFKGLATFVMSDADYFAGRERVVAELVARLVGATFLGVVGPSGSGKSSVVHAGLLPALGAGIIPGSERWPQLLMRPGQHPMAELEQALQIGELTETLMTNARSPRGGALDRSADDRIVLVVDQFEELFTSCHDEDERRQFVRALLARDREMIVVVTLRADFYGRCTAYPELAELLGANQVPVGSMQDEEFRRAIELPARRAGLWVEPELVEALVDDVEGEPGGLPLLSTALLELWQRRQGRALTLETYRKTGGVRGAVARLAEEAYRQFGPQQKQLARGMLMRLAGPGPGETVVRRRVALADLDVEHNEDAARVLSVLTGARLLTTSEDTVEVAHEALLREWPRLRSWLEEDADGRRLYQHVIEAAKEWDERGRDEADLYRGARLASVLDKTDVYAVELNERERRFLDESRRVSERELERQRGANRRLRYLLAGSAVLLVAALAAGVFAFVLRQRAQDEARVASARELAAAALAGIDNDRERSTLLAIEAAETTRRNDGTVLPEAEDALYRALGDLQAVRAVHGAGSTVALAPDGRRFVSAGSMKNATIWDAITGERVRVLAGHGAAVRAVDYSPDGRLIATGSADNTAKVWDASTGAEIRTLDGHRGEVVSVQFSPSGRFLVTVSQDHAARVWDLRTGTSLPPFKAWSGGPARPPYGRDLASLSSNGRLVIANVLGRPKGVVARVFDVPSRHALPNIELLTREGFVAHDVDVSPDGSLVAAVSSRELGLWQLPGGEFLGDLIPAHRSDVWDVEFAPNGQRLATAGADGRTKLWVRTPTGVRELVATQQQSAAVATLSFSRDGSLLLTGSRDGTARLYDLSAKRLLDVARHRVTRSLTTEECRQYLHVSACPRRGRA